MKSRRQSAIGSQQSTFNSRSVLAVDGAGAPIDTAMRQAPKEPCAEEPWAGRVGSGYVLV